MPQPNSIQMFFHCKKCLEEMPENTSPREFIRIEAGYTYTGDVQIWCVRHEMHIINIETSN